MDRVGDARHKSARVAISSVKGSGANLAIVHIVHDLADQLPKWFLLKRIPNHHMGNVFGRAQSADVWINVLRIGIRIRVIFDPTLFLKLLESCWSAIGST